MSDRICVAPECPNEQRARGYCPKHLYRLKVHGSLDLPPKSPKPQCAHDGCTKTAKAKGYCKQCYLQFWRYGTAERRGPLTGQAHPHWAEVPSYFGWHARLRKIRGAAADQLCAVCGGRAEEWALVKSPAGDLHHTDGMAYTLNADDYIALRRDDHRTHDEHDEKVRATWRSK